MGVSVLTSVNVNGHSLQLRDEEVRELLRKLADKVSLTDKEFWQELKNAR